MAFLKGQVFRQSLQQDPNDSCGYFSILVHNYGGRRKHESQNSHVQADLDETRATAMFIQEAGGEFFALMKFGTCHIIVVHRKQKIESNGKSENQINQCKINVVRSGLI